MIGAGLGGVASEPIAELRPRVNAAKRELGDELLPNVRGCFDVTEAAPGEIRAWIELG